MDSVTQLRAALGERYDIEGEIGAGGMATVYLARDLRHERRVALKVLRPDLGAVLGVERFLSEIRVTANLQHPNLLPLFDSGTADGQLFYVMPFVEGESLRARLEREKQLPVEESLRIANAIAGALDYAHRNGVIHRDLKPENILLQEGQPLVADFGIALAVSNAGGGRITQTGLSLGTPQYMSPEQATGDRVVDARTDVYSLAAVLYEMLTGEAPHTGTTSQAIIARLLTEKPRTVRSMRPNVPPHVEAAVARALEKLPADRFATAQELADALSGKLVTAPAGATWETGGGGSGGSAFRLRHPLVLALMGLAVTGWAGLAWSFAAAPEPEPGGAVRFHVAIPESEGEVRESGPTVALSPDGRTLVYQASLVGAAPRLYARRLDQTASRPLPTGEGTAQAAFSPDGRWLAYVQEGQLFKVALDAGSPVRVADVGLTPGVAWAPQGIIVGAPLGSLGIVPDGGGEETPLIPLDTAAGETAQRFPVVLADGETVLYLSWRDNAASSRLAAVSLRTRETTDLGIQGIAPLGIVAGVLVYHDGRGSLVGVPFDAKRRRVTGGPIPLEDTVAFSPGGVARAALSSSGTLAYVRRSASSERELMAIGLDGVERPVTPLRRRYRHPRYSPDGRRIGVGIETDSIDELWVHDLESGTLNILTRGMNSRRFEWSPDGRDIVFSSNRDGAFALYRVPADGSAPPQRIQGASERGQPVQGLFSPGGASFVYRTGFNGDDLWYRSWEGDTTSHALAADPSYIERNPAFSPDGRWIAYASNESGAYQVYVRPFPGPGPRYPITVAGGDAPVWSPDGSRIYYTVDDRFEEAVVTLGPRVSVTRAPLGMHEGVMDPWHRAYDLAPDGSHFLVVRPVGAGDGRSRLVVVHDWAAAVRERVAGPGG